MPVLEIINGAIRTSQKAYEDFTQQQRSQFPVAAQVADVVGSVVDKVADLYSQTALGVAEEEAAKIGSKVAGPIGAIALGTVVPGPDFSGAKATLQFRPNVKGMRNAEARAILGDYVTDPDAVKARPGTRLESDPSYKLLQKGRPPEPGETMTSMPNFMSPHHRIDVKGSIPFFEGSTEAANVQRRADLAVADLFPGNDPRNYIGLWDGPLSGKASKKTGVYSTDHQDVHKAMEDLRRKFGLKAKGGTDAVAELPDDVKTGLLADLSMRDELAGNKVLATRMDMIHEAFPDMSYDEIKNTILTNPKRFANLSRTSEGYLYSLIAPQ